MRCWLESYTSVVSRGNFSFWSVKTAAEHLSIKWPFEIINIGRAKILTVDGDGDKLRKAFSTVRRRTSERGCINVLALADECELQEAKLKKLTRILEFTAQARWLDDTKEWLYSSESPRNRLYNLCSKVLGVSNRIRPSELRRAVSRSRRLTICPPQRILGLFVEEVGLGQL
jgi:hypothetical protein